MFNINQQLGEFKTLLCQMSRQLDAIAMLLQKIAEQERLPSDSYTVTIDEAAWREWMGQNQDD